VSASLRKNTNHSAAKSKENKVVLKYGDGLDFKQSLRLYLRKGYPQRIDVARESKGFVPITQR